MVMDLGQKEIYMNVQGLFPFKKFGEWKDVESNFS